MIGLNELIIFIKNSKQSVKIYKVFNYMSTIGIESDHESNPQTELSDHTNSHGVCSPFL